MSLKDEAPPTATASELLFKAQSEVVHSKVEGEKLI